MSKEVWIEEDECTSCGQCADNLPEVFQMNDDDIAYVVDSAAGSEEAIQDEIDECPGECIHWKE